MPSWPEVPIWYDPDEINKGEQYAGADGFRMSDLNKIIIDLLYLKGHTVTDDVAASVDNLLKNAVLKDTGSNLSPAFVTQVIKSVIQCYGLEVISSGIRALDGISYFGVVHLSNYLETPDLYVTRLIDESTRASIDLLDIIKMLYAEWDHVITDPTQFTTENLTTMSGNIIVKCDIEAIDEDMFVTIPEEIKLINFNGHRTNYSITGHQDCRLISAVIGMGASSYETYMSNFASVEFCTGYGCFRNCSRIAHSSIWNAYNCSFITDVVTSKPESQVATFYQCSNITNVKVEDVSDESSMGVEFEECSNISNVTKHGSADGVITYTNCTYVDTLTCVGYGVGVPYIDANGTVSFLESAEGGSYGS